MFLSWQEQTDPWLSMSSYVSFLNWHCVEFKEVADHLCWVMQVCLDSTQLSLTEHRFCWVAFWNFLVPRMICTLQSVGGKKQRSDPWCVAWPCNYPISSLVIKLPRWVLSNIPCDELKCWDGCLKRLLARPCWQVQACLCGLSAAAAG